MVFESINLNDDHDFNSSTFVYGNNPPRDNMFPYKQIPLNSLQQFSVNHNFLNSTSQVISNISTSSTLPIQTFNQDPFLSTSSFPPLANHLGHITNDGFMCSSNLKLVDDFESFIQPNVSQHQYPMVIKNDGDKLLGFEDSELLCVNGNKILHNNVKEKERNKREAKNYHKGCWKKEEDKLFTF